MKIKLSDISATIYTPDGSVWEWDDLTQLYYVERDRDLGRLSSTLPQLLNIHGEVSSEPYWHTFKVGDWITTEQEAQRLPVSTIILDRDNVPNHKTTTGYWYAVDGQHLYLSGELNLPATILWM